MRVQILCIHQLIEYEHRSNPNSSNKNEILLTLYPGTVVQVQVTDADATIKMLSVDVFTRKFARKFCVRFSLNQSWRKQTLHEYIYVAHVAHVSVAVPVTVFGGAQRCSARQVLSCSLHLKAARGEKCWDGWSSVEPYRGVRWSTPKIH